jgi:hypothetical protein
LLGISNAECLNNIALDDSYSLEQLKDPRMSVSVVRPLVDALYKLQDVSVGRSNRKP